MMSIPKPTSLFQSSINTLVPPFPLWLYKYLAAFPVTGILGLDHFALGSYFTGMAKSIVNIVTLGSWYAYDVVQVYNAHNLRQNGLKVPFLEMGSIGQGRIDDDPLSIMTKNSKLWLYILILACFGGIYFCTTFFISDETDLLSVLIYYVSNISFYISLAIALFIVYFFFTAKSTNLFASATTKNNAVSNLMITSGVKANPLASILGNRAGMGSIPGIAAMTGTMFGGGGAAADELTSIAQQVMEGGAAKESFQHIYFGLIVALIPLSGFLIYTLRKYKKSSYEVSP